MGAEALVQAKQLNAKVVLRVFSGHAQPLSWKFLNSALGTSSPAQIKKLRQVLKGLLRTHELRLIDGHLYERLLVDKEPTENEALRQGEVTRVDGVNRLNGLSVLPAKKGLPVARPGDRVDYQVVSGKAQILNIVKHSPRPVVGVLNLKGRFPSAEPLGRNFGGRVQLRNQPQRSASRCVSAKATPFR